MHNHSTTLTVKAHRGDRKTLLGFNLSEEESRGLAGFSIAFSTPGSSDREYLPNDLVLDPATHPARDTKFPANSSANAPFQKFRWLHVPANGADGKDPVTGTYTYHVTPRFFGDDGKLQALDDTKTVETKVEVGAFQKGGLTLGFTRGYVASQAFVNLFGDKLTYQPKDKPLTFCYSPKTRVKFWEGKFARNVLRDAEVRKLLRGLGWRTIIVWECKTRHPTKLEKMLRASLDRFERMVSPLRSSVNSRRKTSDRPDDLSTKSSSEHAHPRKPRERKLS